MAVVCERCGHRAERVFFEPPPTAAREVNLFLALVLFCALLGMYNLSVVLFNVLPIVDKADEAGVTGVELPGSRLGLLRDFVQLYENSSRYFLATMLLAMVAIPARAVHLVVSSLGGNPRALPRLRTILLAQFGVELFTTCSLLALGWRLEVIQIPFHFGYNLVAAPIAYGASLRLAVREHFSAHRLDRVPPAAPAA